MDKKIGLVLGVLVLVSIGLTGCSSGGGDGASHGVSSSKKLNTLTQQEIDKICENIDSRMSSAADSIGSIGDDNDFMCTMEAVAMTVATGGTTADCESAKETCLEEYEEWDQESESDWEDSSSSEEIPCRTTEEVADCEATVGEIDACFDAYISEMKKAANEAKAVIEKISCSNLEVDIAGLQEMGSDIPDMEDIPACQKVEEQCPGVMDLSSGMSYDMSAESSSW
jgi:phage terminase Nu1 subunit (DNA packaging protein)